VEQVLRMGWRGSAACPARCCRSWRPPQREAHRRRGYPPEALDRCRERYGCETYLTVEAMCESPNVDAVWICTPNLYHAEHAIIAAEHSKHVICEKPMAVSLDQAKEMVAAVERNGVRYVQGHSRIFDAPIRKMREVVSSGELGRVIQINTWEYKPGSPASRASPLSWTSTWAAACSIARDPTRSTSYAALAAAW